MAFQPLPINRRWEKGTPHRSPCDFTNAPDLNRQGLQDIFFTPGVRAVSKAGCYNCLKRGGAIREESPDATRQRTSGLVALHDRPGWNVRKPARNVARLSVPPTSPRRRGLFTGPGGIHSGNFTCSGTKLRTPVFSCSPPTLVPANTSDLQSYLQSAEEKPFSVDAPDIDAASILSKSDRGSSHHSFAVSDEGVNSARGEIGWLDGRDHNNSELSCKKADPDNSEVIYGSNGPETDPDNSEVIYGSNGPDVCENVGGFQAGVESNEDTQVPISPILNSQWRSLCQEKLRSVPAVVLSSGHIVAIPHRKIDNQVPNRTRLEQSVPRETTITHVCEQRKLVSTNASLRAKQTIQQKRRTRFFQEADQIARRMLFEERDGGTHGGQCYILTPEPKHPVESLDIAVWQSTMHVWGQVVKQGQRETVESEARQLPPDGWAPTSPIDRVPSPLGRRPRFGNSNSRNRCGRGLISTSTPSDRLSPVGCGPQQREYNTQIKVPQGDVPENRPFLFQTVQHWSRGLKAYEVVPDVPEANFSFILP